MSRAKKLTQRLLPVVVSAAALAWVFTAVDLTRLGDAFTWKVAAVLVPALAAYGVVTLVLEAASLVRLVRPTKPFGLITAARVKCASYLLAIVNYTLGAAALSWLLRRRAGIGLGESASVVLLIISIDLVILLGLATVGAALFGTEGPAIGAAVAAVAGVGFFGGLLVLRAPVSLGPLERIRTLAIFEALRTTPVSLLAQLGVLRLLFTSSFIALGGAAFYAFGISLSASTLVFGMVVLGIVGALPIAVAGLGTGQVAAVLVFGKVADEGTLVALSLVLSAGLISLHVLMGLVFAREFTREALAQARSAEE